MVKYHIGDIFKAPVQVIIHQANCFCTMKSGVAKAVKALYPRAAASDAMTASGDVRKLGDFSFALADGKQDRTIINLYGQYRYGYDGKRYTDYKALVRGFNRIKDFLTKMEMEGQVIGIPYKMGSDRGGGDWEIVEGIIKAVFESSPFTIFICKLE